MKPKKVLIRLLFRGFRMEFYVAWEKDADRVIDLLLNRYSRKQRKNIEVGKFTYSEHPRIIKDFTV